MPGDKSAAAFRSHGWVGVPLALASAVAFALANTCARLAYQGGGNPPTVAAVRFVLPTIVLVMWLRAGDVPIALPPRSRWTALALGVVTAIHSWAVLTAISTIPLALAILVFYLFPLIAAVIIAVFGWEKLRWPVVAAIAVAFVGLALALNPPGGDIRIEGLALALAGAIGLATVVAVSGRVLRSRDPRPVTLHMTAVAAVLLVTMCAAQGAFVFPRTNLGWAGIVGFAAFYAFAIITFYIAVSMIGPVQVALLCYAEPVASAVLGVAILGEPLAPVQIVGIALVVIALVGATLARAPAK